MRVVRSWSFASSVLLLLFIGCDRSHPLEPLDAAVVGGVKAPSGTSALPTSSSTILVTWTDNTQNEDGFRVERSATTAGPWVLAGTTGANVTSWSDGQRAPEQQMCYRVVALRRNNASNPSNSDCTTPPAAPTGLAATRVDEQTVQLAWTDKSAAEDGYEVQRATSEVGLYIAVADLAADATSYRETGLSPSAYWYRVRAKRDGGFGDFSNLAFAPHPGVPLAPSGTNATPGGSNWVTITWVDNATDETGARVERSMGLGTTWTTVVTIYGTNATSATDYWPTSEQQLCYRVIASNANGDSPPSNTDCTAPPAAPSGLTATVVDSKTVDLAWIDNSTVEDGYEVRRAREGEDWSSVADLPPNSKTYRDVVTSDAAYWYMIRAKKDGGFSNSSNAVRVVVASMPPAAPSGVAARPEGSTVVAVSWSDNSSNEEGFRVERSTDGEASWQVAGTTGISITWLQDADRVSERQVCYRVVAFNATGNSPSLNPACTAPPAAPANLVATPVASDAIDLTWTNNLGVRTGYEVQRVFCYQDYYGWWICDYSPIATLGADATTYHDVGLNPSESYTYRVLALRDGGYSDPSNEYSATTYATAP